MAAESRPSLLSRLRSKTSSLSLSALRSPRRTPTSFYIRLDDPHRVYSPTDTIKGCVCITVERSLHLTHLAVCLIGRVELNLSGKEPDRKRKEWDDRYDDGTSDSTIFCKDEIVLCGSNDGRPLDAGAYEFRFELMFVPVGKEDPRMPSSLDFEKGSISYNISSTLTRPTTLSPITTCSTKINMVETIDIGILTPPKPRTIALEPIVSSRRSRKRPSSPATTPSITSSPNSSSGNLSPSSDPGSYHASPTANPTYLKSKTITASVELMKAGALPGDFIPVKISIHHNKPIKSMYGIILTLQRQTRFDPISRFQPPLKKALSSATGGGTFRKDLSQTCMPLLVDPKTLTYVVSANVKVPEDVFPTITSAPGGEVSFRYYVEVVVDLGGKLGGKGGPGISITRPKTIEGDNGGGIMSEGAIVETERIRRRGKSIVFFKFEVVIGSVDSVGGRGRRGGIRHISIPKVPEIEEENDVVDVQLVAPASPMVREHPERQEYPEHAPDYTQHLGDYQDLPPLEPEEPMDEKTRLRLAEQTLLPSAPPGIETGENSSSAPPLAPEETPEYYPSAPPVDQGNGAEDKLETERRRLLQAASGPSDSGSSGSSGGAASAPVLDDVDLEGGLPRYFR